MTDTDFDGCSSRCRKAGAHTLVWGGCEHAAEPEPTVTLMHPFIASDGHPAIGSTSITVTDLADRFAAELGASLAVSAEAAADAGRKLAEGLARVGREQS